MIALNITDRIFLYSNPIDFRKQINSLLAMVQNVICEDPYSGSYFIFMNRDRNSVKILHYDGQGVWLHQKRLSRGKFQHLCQIKNNPHLPLDSTVESTNSTEIIAKGHSIPKMSYQEALVLLMNGNPQAADFQVPWKKVA